jgi:hypothetical protein
MSLLKPSTHFKFYTEKYGKWVSNWSYESVVGVFIVFIFGIEVLVVHLVILLLVVTVF